MNVLPQVSHVFGLRNTILALEVQFLEQYLRLDHARLCVFGFLSNTRLQKAHFFDPVGAASAETFVEVSARTAPTDWSMLAFDTSTL